MLRERTRLESELTDLGLKVASGRRSLRESFSPKSLPEVEYETTPAATYDDALTYALNNLKPKFGLPFAEGKYDKNKWQIKPDRAYVNMLVLRRGINPSQAIKEIVDENKNVSISKTWKWHLDCAYFVQVAHLYALSQLDPRSFDKTWKNKNFHLRQHWSDGAGEGYIKYRFRRRVDIDKKYPWQAYYNKRWNTLPSKWDDARVLSSILRGGRVMWNNPRMPKGYEYRNENAVKVGDDRYRAFPLETPSPYDTDILSSSQIKLRLGEAGRRFEISRAESTALPNLQTYTDRYIFLKEALCFRRP